MSALSSAELQHIIDQLRIMHEHLLVHRPVHNILESIDATVARFLDPASQERQEAELVLPSETGLSPAMIRHILPLLFQEYRIGLLEELLDSEFGYVRKLDKFVHTLNSHHKIYGPALITQILAGNIPGAGLDGIIFAFLVKSATLVKTASSMMSFPKLFAQALTRIDRDLGTCLAVVQWQGGNVALEDVAFARSEVVVASGSDESLVAIRSRVRGKFIGYGHKISFGVIGKEMLANAADLAERAAYDVVLFDQQGCLSPQLIYVEQGGAVSPDEFAALVAQALERWQHILPRGKVSPEASIAIQRVRDETEWQALAGKNVALYTSPGSTAWTVIYDADPTFIPSPLYRTIRIKSLSSLIQLESILAAWRLHLEAVGVAIGPDRHEDIADLLGRIGVSRICPIGTMQTPPLSWRHGGRPRLADLVRWVGVETAHIGEGEKDKGGKG